VLGRRYRVVLEPDDVVRDSSVAEQDHVYLGREIGALGVVAAEADSGPDTYPLYLLDVDERGRMVAIQLVPLLLVGRMCLDLGVSR
jgi:hypothetical protein